MTLPYDPQLDPTRIDWRGFRFGLPDPRERAATPPAGVLSSGLRTGFNDLQALGGAAASAVGKLTQQPWIERWGSRVAAEQSAEADQYRNAQLEGMPWREGGPAVLPWLGYQVAKNVPQMAAQVAAAVLMPEVAAPAWLARLGAMAPKALGGGGLRAGMSVAEQAAAATAGRGLAAGALGAGVAGYVPAVGSLYQQAMERGDPTTADAAKALAMGVPYAALDAIEPAGLAGVAARGMTGGLARRVATTAATQAVAEMPQEALQTAMELSFRPDLTPVAKMHQIVDAAITGGAVAGVFGGAAGIRKAKTTPANTIETDDLEAVVDEGLQQPTPPTPPSEPPATGEQLEMFQPNAPTPPRATPPVAPQPIVPEQGNLFAEQEAMARQQQSSIQTMRDLAQAALGKKVSPFVETLTATNPVEMVEAVQQALAQPKPGKDVKTLGVAVGLIDAKGKPRDLAAEIAAANQQVWSLGAKAQSDAAAVPLLEQAHVQLRTLRAKQQVLEQVAARQATRTVAPVVPATPVQAAPVPVAEQVTNPSTLEESNAVPTAASVPVSPVVPEAPASLVTETPAPEVAAADPVSAMRQLAKTIIGRQTAFTKKLTATTPEELRAAVLARLEAGNAAKDTMQLAEHFGIAVNQPSAPVVEAPVTDAPVVPVAPAAPVEPAAPVAAVPEVTPPPVVATPKRTRTPKGTAATASNTRVAQWEAPNGMQYELTRQPDGRIMATEMSQGEMQATKRFASPAEAVAWVRSRPVGAQMPEVAPAATPAPAAQLPDNPVAQVVTKMSAPEIPGTPPADTSAVGSNIREIPDTIPTDPAQLWPQLRQLAAREDLPATTRQQIANVAKELQRRQGGTKAVADARAVIAALGMPEPAATPPTDLPPELGGTPPASWYGRRAVSGTPFRQTQVGEKTAQVLWEMVGNKRTWFYRVGKDLSNDIGTVTDPKSGWVKVDEKGMTQVKVQQRAEEAARAPEATPTKKKPVGRRAKLSDMLRPMEEVATSTSSDPAAETPLVVQEMMQSGDARFGRLYDESYGLARKRWVHTAAREFGGVVAMESQRYAVLRTLGWDEWAVAVWDANSDEVRVYVNPALSDLQALIGSVFADTQEAEWLLDYAWNAARKARVVDATYPDGPFASRSLMRAGNVVGGMATPAPYVGYVNAMLKSVGLDHVRVAVMTASDLKTPLGNLLVGKFSYYDDLLRPGHTAGAAVSPIEPGLYMISIRDRASEVMAAENLAHEVGHIIKWEAFDSAAPEVREKIIEAYFKWRERAELAVGPTFFRMQGTAAVTELGFAQDSNHSTFTPLSQPEYWLDFEEWFAQQTARWVTSQAAPVSLVDQFFAGVAERLRRLIAFVTGDSALSQVYSKEYVHPVMKEFLDAMAAGGPTGGFAKLARTQGPAATQMRTRANIGLPSMDTQLAQVQRLATVVKDKVGSLQGLTIATRRALLGFESMMHIATHYGKWFKDGPTGNGLEQVVAAESQMAATTAHLAQTLFSNAYHQWERLNSKDAKSAKIAQIVGDLMWLSAEFNIDPLKTWDDHKWLHNLPNAATLQQRVTQANKLWGTLRQKNQQQVYEDLRAGNDVLWLGSGALRLYSMVALDPVLKEANIPGFDRAPMEEFLDPSLSHRKTLGQARAFWQDKVAAMLSGVQQYLGTQKGVRDAEKSAAKRDTLNRRIGPVEALADAVRQDLDGLARAPYFHLARFGDFFEGFRVRSVETGTNENGEPTYGVDAQALATIAKRLQDAGYTDARISNDSTKPNVFMRLETADQAANLHKLVLQFREEGLLDPNADIVGPGRRSAEQPVHQFSQEAVNRLIENVRASWNLEDDPEATPEEREQAHEFANKLTAQIREIWLDMQPDMAQSRVLTHREGVPGFSPDMMRAYAFRMSIGVHALASLSNSPSLIEAMTNMRASTREAVRTPEIPTEQKIGMQDIVGEVSRRQAEKPLRAGRTWFDTLRAVNHAFFLGLSPAYTLVNSTQVPILLWPELGKKYGFVKSAKAIGSVTPTAFAIMKNVMAYGASLGGDRWTDAMVTEEALKDLKIPEATKAFIMRMVNTGNIDIGSAARELGRVADARLDAPMDRALRWASFTGYYSETFTRLIAALSAYELHGDKPGVDRYASNVVNEAMLNYSTGNTARQTGKLGLAGPLTPVMTAFMTYQMQVLEKMWREIHTAVVGSDPKAKIEAQRFLGYHAVAVTTLAGTLGMPFASVMARVVDKLVDLFSPDEEEPFDTKAAWRNYLADVFGKDVAEMIAHGAFRGVGIDVAQRIGEQDLLPFSRLLADRRKWQDATKDWALQAWGSPVSMMWNVVQGGGKLADGQVVDGLKLMVPTAIRGPVEAYRMSTDGYVDASGNKLPMSVGARDILSQALGFAPAEKAEYSEANLTQKSRRAALVQQASVLRRQLLAAVESQDREQFPELVRQTQAFDRANPAYAVLPGLREAVVRRARIRQAGQRQGVPYGTNRRDARAAEATAFANY